MRQYSHEFNNVKAQIFLGVSIMFLSFIKCINKIKPISKFRMIMFLVLGITLNSH